MKEPSFATTGVSLVVQVRPASEEKRATISAAPAEAASPEEESFKALRAAGIDPKTGLGYCQNDRDFYMSVLADYARGADGRADKIQSYCDAADWKNYEILVHALKSSSRMIGADALSETAAHIEAAANIAAAVIRKKSRRFMRSYLHW